MANTRVSIGQVDASGLVNRVASGEERITLTSRGKPEAALVSSSDYKRSDYELIEQSVARGTLAGLPGEDGDTRQHPGPGPTPRRGLRRIRLPCRLGDG